MGDRAAPIVVAVEEVGELLPPHAAEARCSADRIDHLGRDPRCYRDQAGKRGLIYVEGSHDGLARKLPFFKPCCKPRALDKRQIGSAAVFLSLRNDEFFV